jgi:hypothetical protein
MRLARTTSARFVDSSALSALWRFPTIRRFRILFGQEQSFTGYMAA